MNHERKRNWIRYV